MAEEQVSITTIIQSVLDDQRAIELVPRDIALLILMRNELQGGDENAISLPYGTMQAVHVKLEQLELKDEQGAERRLNESLNRLTKSECIAKADMVRISVMANAEYQITPVGEALAEWHVKQSEFSGEPLTAIFRSFITALTAIAEAADNAQEQADWDYDVIQPIRYALKGMLVSIQRHQKELDRQHSTLRDLIPGLLHQSSEESIETCEAQLAMVIKTIEDLQEVVFSSTSTAHALIDRISESAQKQEPAGIEAVCDDLSRRLNTISSWTVQRATEWFEHHNVVHQLLRTNIRIDRQRRVTDALKRSIAEEPDWTLEIASEPFFIRMREGAVAHAVQKTPPRQKKLVEDRDREIHEVDHDNLPSVLLQFLREDLESGAACASSILGKAEASAKTIGDLIHHFPWLIRLLAQSGHIDTQARDWTKATSHIEIEELRITNDIIL